MTKELTELSQEMRKAVEQEMRVVLQADDTVPNRFYGMLHYHMGWVDEDMRPTHVNGGKRIRPILCLLCCMTAGGDWSQAIPAAAAIEILHNFSLIHDDIEDKSPTRRGRLTTWKLWGIEQAINAGDAMFAISHLALNSLIDRGVPAPVVVEALRRFDETCLHLTQGQYADLDFETRDDVSVDDYIDMITGKTAVLLSLCAELGARIAGCNDDTTGHYAKFALDLGLAFQVKDDILGIWGDESVTGKSAATDVATKKKTLPVLFGLAGSSRMRELYAHAEPSEEFVAEVIQLLDQQGAYEYASKRAAYYSQSALDHLEAARPSGSAYVALNQLADMLLSRNF